MEVTQVDARATRVGYGTGADVAESRWREALAIPPPHGRRMSRAERLRPQEGMTAILARRARVLEADELVLRALLDLEHDRPRSAAAPARRRPSTPRSAELAGDPVSQGVSDSLNGLARRADDITALTRRRQEQEITPEELHLLTTVVTALADALELWRDEALRE